MTTYSSHEDSVPETIRILHVDDDPEFADLTATFLEREDGRFSIETATSASEGLDRLTESGFDCIVSDYDMSGQNGIAFLNVVRDEYPDLPFILYTGKGSEEVASEAISAGVTDYLQKEGGTNQYTVLANRISNAVEQFRSQQALAERNRELRRYKQMINSMNEAACIYDSEGRFELVNEYLAEWYNTTPEALVGEQSALIPRVREKADGDPYQELLTGERNELRGELDGDFPNHGYAVLEYRLTPLSADGTIEAVVGVARDVTDRRERRTELERKDRAMDAAPVGITISDPSVEDNPLIYVNDRFTELTGYAEAEVFGSNCRFLQGENTDPEPVARMREAIDANDSVTVELRNYRKDGSEFWNRVSIAPVRTDEGDVTNFVGFQQDVTERKRREQELKRQNDRLEEFASIVSHDLRNPLQIAEGELELARDEYDSEHLDAVANAHDRMDTLIEDLLALTRDGKRVSDTEAVDLAELFEDCWRNVETADATVRTSIDRTIRADRSRLAQLLENLIRNAVEHGRDDVTVTVGGLDDGFYVEDDGPGIPEDDRDDVFDAGYSTSEDGTGFGLSIVTQVAEAHGWDVQVTEGTDGGARFEITGIEFIDE